MFNKLKLKSEQRNLILSVSKELKIDANEVLYLLIELGQALMVMTQPTEDDKVDKLDLVLDNYKDLPEYKNYKEIARVFRECFEAGAEQ